MNNVELIDNLKNIDNLLYLKNIPSINLIIFGGAAFSIIFNDFRPTTDIDVIEINNLSDETLKILKDNDINFNGSVHVSGLIELIEEDLTKINFGFKKLNIFIPPIEALIISKIISRERAKGIQDFEDITSDKVFDLLDIDKVEKLFNEYKTYSIDDKLQKNYDE
jgi:hypothetical protein